MILIFTCNKGDEDGNTCSPARNNRSSSPALDVCTENSPSAARPGPDKQQKTSHHQLSMYGPILAVRGEILP